jgi:hypothetical protein
VFPKQANDLGIAWAEMTAAHTQFRQELSQTQNDELRERFSKLDLLQAEVGSRILSLDEELSLDKPDWRRLYSDAHKIKEAADKCRAELKKIAKILNISGSSPDERQVAFW